MRTPSLPRVAMGLALGTLLLVSLSCKDWESEQYKADRTVQASVARSIALQKAPTTQAFDATTTELQRVVNLNASNMSKLQARSLLAMTEYEKGDRILRDLLPLEPQVSRVLWSLSQTAAQIRQVNNSVKAMTANDPKAIVDKITTTQGELTTATQASGNTIKQLQDQIAQVQTQLQQLGQQKDALVTQADADSEKASKMAPKEALPILNNATESRRKASNIGHDMDKLSATLLPLQRDLAAEQARKKNLDVTIAALEENKKTVQANWSETQKQIEEQKGQATRLGQQLTDQAKKLADVEKKADETRKNALAQFEKAAKDYEQSSKTALALDREFGTWMNNQKFAQAAERRAWEATRKLYNAGNYTLRHGHALHAIGVIQSNLADLLGQKQRVIASITPDLQAAGVAVPAELSPVDADLKVAQDAANKNFTEAIENFGKVFETGLNPKNLREAAGISKMFALFGQYVLNNDEAKLTEARKEFQQLFEERKEDPMIKQLPAKLRA